jgi:hypothetical protein
MGLYGFVWVCLGLAGASGVRQRLIACTAHRIALRVRGNRESASYVGLPLRE